MIASRFIYVFKMPRLGMQVKLWFGVPPSVVLPENERSRLKAELRTFPAVSDRLLSTSADKRPSD